MMTKKVKVIGRVKKIVKSPAEIDIERRNSCSISGPKTTPNNTGAIGKLKRLKVKANKPKMKTIMVSLILPFKLKAPKIEKTITEEYSNPDGTLSNLDHKPTKGTLITTNKILAIYKLAINPQTKSPLF